MATPQSALIAVRPVTPADSAPIAELSGQLGYPATPEEIESRLRQIAGDLAHGVFVGELVGSAIPSAQNSRVIGWVHVQERRLLETPLRAEVTALVVAERHRRLGVGRILMQRAEQWARERSCTAVMLRSNVIRTWAHTFYQTLGYQTIKTQKVFLKSFS